MITFLEGKLEEKGPTRVVLNVQGVGYEVLIPLSTYDRLPATGEQCRILTYDHIREDLHSLFGFTTEADREMFTRLLSISGIGPKLALSALSGLSIRDFTAAVAAGDIKMISSISGIGKKMAERIVIELRDKLSAGEILEAGAPTLGELEGSSELNDAMLALMSLGYRQLDAVKMVRKISAKLEGEPTVEEIVRQALTG